MRKYIVPSFVVAVLVCTLSVVSAYGDWAPGESDALAAYDQILTEMEAAVAKATGVGAAHPDFLRDLTGFLERLQALRAELEEPAAEWGDYSSAPTEPLPDLSGTWDILANTTKGTIVFVQNGRNLSGVVLGNAIAEGVIDRDGTVGFVRTGSNQRYSGTFSLHPDGTPQLTGTFDCPVTRTANVFWEASLRHR